MKILVINSGSSSLKYTLFQMADETILFSGNIDRLGLEGTRHLFRYEGQEESERAVHVRDHGEALEEVLGTLTRGPLHSLEQITAVAHRVGHGGKYREAARISQDVMAEIRRMTLMVPLHHPSMIREIEECTARMPNAIHVAVFDTWFHSTIPDHAAIYGLPYRFFAEKGYRRTGFHGNSHAYVAAKAAEFMEKPIEDLKIITCHLGSGSSLCAINRGKSIDTTLGMTALPGLIMGTRCGEVDPGLIPIIMKEEGLAPDDMTDLFYRESGLKGISGLSSDCRDVEAAAREGNKRAALALEAFCYQVKRAIGSMLIVLGGCDVLVFCAGIGRNSPTVRSKVLKGTQALGFSFDRNKNQTVRPTARDPIADISAPNSKTKILVIRTFEELMMARQCEYVVTRE